MRAGPLILNDRHGLHITGRRFRGGKTACIVLNNCSDITIEGCIITAPEGPPDPDDNGPHLAQVNNSKRIRFHRNRFIHTINAECCIDWYYSRDCESHSNTFSGKWDPLRDSATVICPDDGCQDIRSIADHFNLPRQAFSIFDAASGEGHILDGTGGSLSGGHLDKPITANIAYGKPVEMTVIAYPAHLVYAGPGTVVHIKP